MISTSYFLDKLKARYTEPMLDRVETITPNFVVAQKTVGVSESGYRIAHNGEWYVSEALLLAAVSQGVVLVVDQHPIRMEQDFHLSHIKHCEFLSPVVPGDTIRFELTCESINDSGPLTVEALLLVDGRRVCEATLVYAFTHTPSRPQIHPTASVHPTAVLGENVKVGAYSSVGEHVVIGDGTRLEANVMIEKWTEIGSDCHIYSGAVIGSQAQDMKYKGERSLVKIGDRNTIREYVTINRATGPDCETVIGNDNLIFTSVHIGHNCTIGNHVILTNMATLGGHVVIEDRVVVGGCVGVHQFTRIGTGAMIGGYSKVHSDVPPFLLCEGNPAEIRTINVVGLRRSGAKSDELNELKHVFKCLFRNQLNTQQALEALAQDDIQGASSQRLIQFMSESSKRGVLKKTAGAK
jgi:UDP-N-acetylglucosamine acyltransferase